MSENMSKTERESETPLDESIEQLVGEHIKAYDRAEEARKRAAGARYREARAALWVQLLRGLMWPFKPCPTPGIEAFRRHEQAHIAAISIMRHSSRKTGRSAYAIPLKCQCGYWHIKVARGESEWEDSE